ncbi:MAG: hypothetical protein HUJ68_13475 [Clostridia bacterium]|nr:hypothetical protein [Clostridia bacterium]
MKYGALLFMSLISFLNLSCKTTNNSEINSNTKTIKVGQMTFTHNSTKPNSWGEDEILQNAIEKFEIISDGKTPLHEYILGTYAIKAKIRNDNEEKEICLIVDTGAKGNMLQKSIIESFSNPLREKYKFISNFTYSTVSNWDVSGVIIPEFQADGFKMKNVLFEPADVESFGWLDDGTPVNGFIGMITLSQMPFLFSAKDKELVFFSENFNPKGEKIDLISEYPLVLEIPFEINGKTYSVKLDTGGETNLLPYSMYKKNRNNIEDSFELRMSGLRRFMGLQRSMSFCNKECFNIPTIAQKNSFMIGSSDYVMIGEIVLRNFDLYVDYSNSIIYFDSINNDFPKRSMLVVYTSGGGNRYGYFGINLIRDKYNNKLRVGSVYYKDGKKLCPEISVGDYILSINGIDQKDFVLEDLQNYSTVEIRLRHKKKEYTVKLDRSYFENCLEF